MELTNAHTPMKHLLLVRVDDFEGFSWGALKEEAGLADDLALFRRLALVGGPEWFGSASALAGPLAGLDVQAFETEAEARAWLGGETSRPEAA